LTHTTQRAKELYIYIYILYTQPIPLYKKEQVTCTLN
jgi:hypothetical protein